MSTADVVVVGAGAAGLFAALAARGALTEDGQIVVPPSDAPRVVLVDGQRRPGRKILISGGGRCNVTNAEVTEHDYGTTTPRLVRNALRAFGVDATRAAFEAMGVHLREEPLGKLFPTTDRARDVLDALLAAVDRAGVDTRFGAPVTSITPCDDGRWDVGGTMARRVVVATGGRSVPKTGSTGFGYDLARALGHDPVPTVPALAPLLGVAADGLAGLTVPAMVAVLDAEDGRVRARAAGSLLFTHRGVTGPAALDVAEEVERAVRDGRPVRVQADVWSLADPAGPFAEHLDAAKLPGCCLASVPAPAAVPELDRTLQAHADRSPRAAVSSVLADRMPRRLADVVAPDPGTAMGQLRRDDRRRLARALVGHDLRITGTGGYAKAEATAGGVRLDELDRHTLESRHAPGLHWCGEVCDVTGRLGGFNFQWAWTSGVLAGHGASRG